MELPKKNPLSTQIDLSKFSEEMFVPVSSEGMPRSRCVRARPAWIGSMQLDCQMGRLSKYMQ